MATNKTKQVMKAMHMMPNGMMMKDSEMGEMHKTMSKSTAVKKAIAGKDMGKKGKNFNKIAKKAGKEYGSMEAGKRVAGSIFQKMRKSGKL